MASSPSGRNATKADMVAVELRSMIARGEIERGARIPQDELAARFQTSITPVREAIRRLEAEGLLVGQPHRGVRVASANLEDVKGVYTARRLLEPYAAQRATTRVSRRDLMQAEQLLERMANSIADGDSTRVLESNWDFHFLVYRRCGIPSLVEIIETLWLSYPWDVLVVEPARMTESAAEHRAMLVRLTKGDVDGVGEAFANHLARSYLALARHLSEENDVHDVFDLDID